MSGQAGGRPLVIGFYDEIGNARAAFDGLKEAGLREDQIGLACRGDDNSGGETTGMLTEGFLALGLPEEKCRQYERELQAGRAIVVARTDGEPDVGDTQYQQATGILWQHNAYLVDNSLDNQTLG